MAPFSIVLHYLEGDSIPNSHVYPLCQCLVDFVADLPECIVEMFGTEVLDPLASMVIARWEGTMHRVGLRHDVHLAAFFFDVYVRTAVNDPSLITSSVASAAARCMAHLSTATTCWGISLRLLPCSKDFHLLKQGRTLSSLRNGRQQRILQRKLHQPPSPQITPRTNSARWAPASSEWFTS